MNEKRLNRCRIEWKPFFTPAEYVLLDQILWRSNLKDANEGRGYIFHVRQLSKECNIARSVISKIIATWPFMLKKGHSKAMTIQMDYPAFLTWIVRPVDNKGIVRPVDNDCPPGGPISNKEEVSHYSVRNNE